MDGNPAAMAGAAPRAAKVGAQSFLSARDGVVLLVFLLASVAIYGHGALGHLGSVVIGSGYIPGRDQAQVSWFLAWTAHSLSNLRSPLYTHYLNAPEGLSLAWATSSLLLGTLATPLTLAANAFASFNVLLMLAPGLAGWTAYLMCREVAGREAFWPSVGGGVTFALSSYETTQAGSHLNLASVYLVPLLILVVLRRIDGRMGRNRFIILLGVLVAGQLLISTEIAASAAIFGAIALALWSVLDGPQVRARILPTVVEGLGAFALAAVLCVPFLYSLARHAGQITPIKGSLFGLDLANLITTSKETWVPGLGNVFFDPRRLAPNVTEQLAYLGIPLIVLLGIFLWGQRRSVFARFAALFALITLVLAFGATLHVGGEALNVPMPWQLLAHLPLLESAISVRFALFIWLVVATCVTLFLRLGGSLRYALYALVLVSLVPAAIFRSNVTALTKPALMTDAHLLHETIAPGSTVITAPVGIAGQQMTWQIESNFYFKLASGYGTSTRPASYAHFTRALRALEGARVNRPIHREMCRFIARTGARYLIAEPRAPGHWKRVRDTLALRPERVGGLVVYDLRAALQPGGACFGDRAQAASDEPLARSPSQSTARLR